MTCKQIMSQPSTLLPEDTDQQCCRSNVHSHGLGVHYHRNKFMDAESLLRLEHSHFDKLQSQVSVTLLMVEPILLTFLIPFSRRNENSCSTIQSIMRLFA